MKRAERQAQRQLCAHYRAVLVKPGYRTELRDSVRWELVTLRCPECGAKWTDEKPIAGVETEGHTESA